MQLRREPNPNHGPRDSSGPQDADGRPANRFAQEAPPKPRSRYASCRPIPLVRIALLAQHRMLPQRVVGILNRQHRKRRRRSFQACPVGAAEVAGERAHRPPVPGDVMQQNQQNMLAFAPSANTCARSGSSRERSNPRPAASTTAPPQARPPTPPQPTEPPVPRVQTKPPDAEPRPGPETPSVGSRDGPQHRKAQTSSASSSSAPLQPHRQRDSVSRRSAPPDGPGTTAGAAHRTTGSQKDASPPASRQAAPLAHPIKSTRQSLHRRRLEQAADR